MKKYSQLDSVIISLVNNSEASLYTRRLLASIKPTNNHRLVRTPLIMHASTPETAGIDMYNLMSEPQWIWPTDKIIDSAALTKTLPKVTAKILKYTWPVTEDQNKLDFVTGLYHKAYSAVDHYKIVACTVSHVRAWMQCIISDRDLLIFEHDAMFNEKLEVEAIYNTNPKFGILSLNNPLNATRRARVFHDKMQAAYAVEKKIVLPTPTVNNPGEPPVPQGLPGNSAYIIQPWAAKQALAKLAEVGIWPNDALLCREFFPWIKSLYPYATQVQPHAKSTTTL